MMPRYADTVAMTSRRRASRKKGDWRVNVALSIRGTMRPVRAFFDKSDRPRSTPRLKSPVSATTSRASGNACGGSTMNPRSESIVKGASPAIAHAAARRLTIVGQLSVRRTFSKRIRSGSVRCLKN